jgi:hypothetical protein
VTSATRRVGVEPRISGQLGGDNPVVRFGYQKVGGAGADQQRRDSVCGCLAGVNYWRCGGHGYIVSCASR